MEKDELIALAKEARSLSYSPYSGFAVGAAVLTRDGRVFKGANVENASYPCTMCGERNAVYHAYMEGVSREDIVALAIVADGETPVSPCGACRQVLSELLPAHTTVYLGNLKGDVKVTSVEELLPYAFDGSDL